MLKYLMERKSIKGYQILDIQSEARKNERGLFSWVNCRLAMIRLPINLRSRWFELIYIAIILINHIDVIPM